MFPWLWLWAPRVEFPLSGDVVQDIEPTLAPYFGRIAPPAGNGRIESKAVQVASYGRQLGLLTDVVIGLAEQSLPKGAEAQRALEQLKQIRGQIAELKTTEYEAQDQQLETQLRDTLGRGGPRAKRVAARLRPLLDGA